MNHFEPHESSEPQLGVENNVQRSVGPRMIAAILVLAVVVGFLEQSIPAVRAFTMPRFGWIGLVLCMNPLIFLLPYLWTPKKSSLDSSAFMCCVIGAVNAAGLLSKGTVSIVSDEYLDRLHSSWFWSVLPLFAAGGYLYWHSMRMNPRIKAPRSGEQTSRGNGDKSSN